MDITAEIITSFRVKYPLFSDETKWPDVTVTIALEEGDAETGSTRWGAYEDSSRNLKQRGLFSFAAHWLVSFYPSGANATQSSVAKNTVTAKSVGDESVTYGAASLSDIGQAGDGWLASTQFGQQFTRLRKRVGMGCLAV